MKIKTKKPLHPVLSSKGKIRRTGTLLMICLGLYCTALVSYAEAFGPAMQSSADDALISPSSGAEAILSGMTTEEKAAQLFFITPDALTGVDGVTMAGDATREAYNTFPVGGLVYFESNIESRDQCAEMTASTQAIARDRIGLPVFIGADEEGGTVTRISKRGIEGVPEIPSMESIGDSGDPKSAYNIGSMIGAYMKSFGFNVDFAPVADVASNPDNYVIGSRSFGSDAALDAQMAAQEVTGLSDQGILATLKHFPGHGDTEEDSHSEVAVSYKTLEELNSCEFLPFISGIESGAAFIMAGHVALPNVTGDTTPASISYDITTGILRNRLGYDGIVITDAMNMAGICDYYDSAEAAVRAIKAGADMILMPVDFQSAYYGILAAVEDGTISEERLNESVLRIIRCKLTLN